MNLPKELHTALVNSSRKQDVEKITRAYVFAEAAHTGQKRKSGEDFINHPLQTAITLSQWNLDTDTIVAGLLHDTIEDGGATRNDIVREFGESVATLVDGVTNISNIRLKGNTKESFVENLRKMILVMAKDLRVVLVKLADRLHNMQTISSVQKEKQRRIAQETLEIYAPLAERLGIGAIKSQLEDLSFPILYPKEYKWIMSYAAPYYKDASKHLAIMQKQLHGHIQKHHLKDISIQTRPKYFYSLYLKLLRPEHNKNINEIHDLIALRIICNTIEECYILMGIVHALYRPVLNLGVRDYIANPKANGYRSIHTNVFAPHGDIVEVQIRTKEMHNEAEMGIAAHWHYNEVKKRGLSDDRLEKGTIGIPYDKLAWVKELVVWQKQITNNEEYMNTLKFDALQHRNLVFSPQGDVFDLPKGATPIDYAYAVHSKLGNQVGGAKVNGKIVPLSHVLHNGDVVEILVNHKRNKPSEDWLQFVVTTHARTQIHREVHKSTV